MGKSSSGAYTCKVCGKRVKAGHKKYGSEVPCSVSVEPALQAIVLDESGLLLKSQGKEDK